MSVHRYAARRDTAEPAIIEALKAAGATVVMLSAAGVADLLVAAPNRVTGHWDTYLMEVKSKGGKLTPAQDRFMTDWPASNLFVVRTAEEALRAIGAIN